MIEDLRGRTQPLTRETLGTWLAQLPADEGSFAVEATTGWPWRRDRSPGCLDLELLSLP